MSKIFLQMLLVVLLLIEFSSAFGQEIEDGTSSQWKEITGIILGAIIASVIAPLIKKRHAKKLIIKKELFKKPSFFVQKIRWSGTNLTFAVLFDNERILFVHAHEITKAPKDSALEEILKMSKHNFQISLEEIMVLDLIDDEEGYNGVRAGILYVDSKRFHGEFDVMAGQELSNCKKILGAFWPPKNLPASTS